MELAARASKVASVDWLGGCEATGFLGGTSGCFRHTSEASVHMTVGSFIPVASANAKCGEIREQGPHTCTPGPQAVVICRTKQPGSSPKCVSKPSVWGASRRARRQEVHRYSELADFEM